MEGKLKYNYELSTLGDSWSRCLRTPAELEPASTVVDVFALASECTTPLSSVSSIPSRLSLSLLESTI